MRSHFIMNFVVLNFLEVFYILTPNYCPIYAEIC